MRKNSFNKSEKLCSKKEIDALFKTGKAFNNGVVRVIYSLAEREDPSYCSVLISVSKKKIRKASDRNTIKRKIREAYRLNKSELINQLENENRKLNIAIIFRGEVKTPYKKIEDKIILSLQRLATLDGESIQGNS